MEEETPKGGKASAAGGGINRGTLGGKFRTPPDMLEINRFFADREYKKINFREVIAALPTSVGEMLISGFDMKRLAKIFEDEGMMQTADAYLMNGMNISETARKLYMHRNTLMYRLKRISKNTGLDLSNFSDAVTFKLLHFLYLEKKS